MLRLLEGIIGKLAQSRRSIIQPFALRRVYLTNSPRGHVRYSRPCHSLSHRGLSLFLSACVCVSRVSMLSTSLLSSLSTASVSRSHLSRAGFFLTQLRATSPGSRSSICDITLNHPIPQGHPTQALRPATHEVASNIPPTPRPRDTAPDDISTFRPPYYCLRLCLWMPE
jgi:hypothetical protein